MIALDGVTVSYNSLPALRNLSLQIEDGEFVLLTGPSGCGKSTLARALSGLIPHAFPARAEGSIQVAGLDPRRVPLSRTAARVGLVFQNPSAQLFNLTVEDEVAFGPRNLGLDEAEVTERVAWSLAATGTQGLKGRAVHTLSDGEKQRVAIAAVLAMGPQLLILDEPTSSLDLPGTRKVVETLERLHREKGLTILLIEHRLGEVAQLAGRTLLMEEGEIVTDGPTREVLSGQAGERLGLQRHDRTMPGDWEKLLRQDGCVPPRGATPLVKLEGLEAGYRERVVLRDLDVAIHPGEFVALVGDNGAGKTTLARVIAGLLKPTRGKVCFAAGPRIQLGREIGLLFQDPLDQLFCETVDEEVAFGPRNWGTFDSVLHAETLKRTHLTALTSRPIYALSSGQQQRTALAAVLALRPRLILIDEPTLGQDQWHLSQFMAFVEELNQAGAAILLITHNYRLVRRYARRVILLRDGRIAADGVPA
ncbi:MAG: ATP-binding cassette domain-containing protein [Anaerolineae bacterium]|jgi:energy-coupling factor transport system ATP-binding protein